MSDTTALVLIVASVALAISMLLSARTRRMPASTRRESGAGLDITDVITAIVLAVIGLAIIVDPSMIESLMAAGLVVAKVVGSIVLLVGLAVLLLVCAAVGTMWRIKSRLRTEARRARHMI